MVGDYLKRILTSKVYDVAKVTPTDQAVFLSKRLDRRVFLKREDLQPVFSFKVRGAYNKIAKLSPEARARGVIAASAGNHAQGVALAAARHGIRALILMPETTPEIKVDSVVARGAEVLLHGETFDEACAHALFLAERDGLCFIHPYDDPDVIAGQGTVAQEILQQQRDPLEAVFVPVGGGGLLAGMAVVLKALAPEVRVIGVESEESACLYHALQAGERVTLPHVGLFADGVAVARIGEETFRLARQLVDEVITVTTDEICAAIKDIFDDTRSVAEPAGALALAGLKKYAARQTPERGDLVAVLSGANMNFHRLRHVSERSELGEKREAVLAVTIPERPGSFKAFCKALNQRQITEFNYRYTDPRWARIFVGVALSDGVLERARVTRTLRDAGYPAVDLSDNELAKLHVRYMVGGHAPDRRHEVLFRFEFPERPGALLKFLDGLGARWNISLFHYRNHCAACGRVLAGLEVPPDQRAELYAFLDGLGYPYCEETDNPAYRLFLGDRLVDGVGLLYPWSEGDRTSVAASGARTAGL